jgi:hypothetical protein
VPLPLIPVAVALLASSAFGLKKGTSAISARKEANELGDDARRIFERTRADLDAERRDTSDTLEKLGRYRLDLWQRQLGRFVVTFRRLKNTQLVGSAATDGAVGEFGPESLPELEFRIGEARAALTSVAGGTLSGMAVGAGAAFGTSTLAAASTGTAIAGLSGAAATNATLAWLGGGSLAAGGFGMAGGMAVLGGIVAAPVLAVGGFMFNKSMQAKLDQAKSHHAEAERAAFEMSNATALLKGIRRITTCFHRSLEILDGRTTVMLVRLEEGIRIYGDDVARYTLPQRRFLHVLVETVGYLKNMLEAPILDENGCLNPKLVGAIAHTGIVDTRAIEAGGA